jgi:hypothetical protein
MRSVVYREAIIINGREYEITNCDFSEFIQTLIDDKELPENVGNYAIFDYVLEETPLRK